MIAIARNLLNALLGKCGNKRHYWGTPSGCFLDRRSASEGWGNQFGVRYGIFSMPTMWLVDKRGNLRETNSHGDLESLVTATLNETTL
jgi:hypothetical protein